MALRTSRSLQDENDQANIVSDSCKGKIDDMGSVVATLTGYSGDARSNLIKLINSSGGYYVGKLLKGLTTHVVCWTFEGPKYEMAKRFGIHTVNHRFFEESLEEGKRLSESSYISLSGKQVGPVLWKAPKQESAFDKSHQPNTVVAELPCEAISEHNTLSPKESWRGLSEEFLDFSDDDQDLQILLNNKSKKGVKRKRKASMGIKNQSLRKEAAKHGAKKSFDRPSHGGQSNHGDIRNRVSHSMLDYIYITDEIDLDENQRTPMLACKNLTLGIPAGRMSPDISLPSSKFTKLTQPEGFEDCYSSPFTCPNTREQKQESLSDYDSMGHRKKQRLLGKTDAVTPVCGFDAVVAGAIDMANPRSSVRAALRTETLSEELALTNITHCTDVARLHTCENPSKSPIACTVAGPDIACVICHTDHINSAEGVLTCGHCFCYQCIKKWATEVVSKTPTCPLCKAPFDMITKREQKIGLDNEEITFEECVVSLGCGEKFSSEQLGDSTLRLACIMCGSGDMEEVLLTCAGCGTRSVHSFCLDPPLPPVPDTSWFCGRCSQRRRADATWWHQLHVFEGLEV